MNLKKSDELLLKNLKNTDTLIEQTKTRTQETLEFKLTKSRDTFSLNPPLESEEEKQMIAATNSEVYSSVFKITEHNILSIYKHEFWEKT